MISMAARVDSFQKDRDHITHIEKERPKPLTDPPQTFRTPASYTEDLRTAYKVPEPLT